MSRQTNETARGQNEKAGTGERQGDRRSDVNDRTGADEPNRYLNTKANKGQHATGVALQGHIKKETGGSGTHDGQDYQNGNEASTKLNYFCSCVSLMLVFSSKTMKNKIIICLWIRTGSLKH